MMAATAKFDRYDRLFFLAALLMLVVVLLVYQDFGIIHDEPIQNEYGNFVYNYYASGREDVCALTFHNLYLYGGLFDGTAALINKFSPLGEYET
ncbi:MAG: hypothetical protein KJ626_04240, partial [Verrucomicrobia bacterium]|nr:hypothetical protein [Verrucomicrobiota bacterium]